MEKPNIAVDLESHIRGEAAKSFLERATDKRKKDDDTLDRVNAVFEDYAKRTQFQDAVLGLVPTPGRVPKMSRPGALALRQPVKPQKFLSISEATKKAAEKSYPSPSSTQESPVNYAVVPAALKYLRRLVRKQEEAKPTQEIPQMRRMIFPDSVFDIGINNTKYRSRNSISDVPIIDGKPVAYLYSKQRQITPKGDDLKYKIGDDVISRDAYEKLIFKLITHARYSAKAPEEDVLAEGLRKDIFNNVMQPVNRRKTIDLEIGPFEAFPTPSTKAEKKYYEFNQRKNLPINKNLYPPVPGFDEAANKQGLRAVKKMLPVLKSFFPETSTVSGERISGAKFKNNKNNRDQEIHLPTMSEYEMQKYRSAAKKFMHEIIQERGHPKKKTAGE